MTKSRAPARISDTAISSLIAPETMMNGTSGMLSFAETEGDWTFGVSGAFSSPGFEINDAGFQTTVDRIVDVLLESVQPNDSELTTDPALAKAVKA